MSTYEDIRLEGHIIDSLLLPRVLDDILERGGEYRILRFRMGREKNDHSLAILRVTASSQEKLDAILRDLQQHGVEILEQNDVRLEPAPSDGVFPEDFYSTTNLETFVRLDGHWIPVQWPEMDCGIMVDAAVGTARTIPLIQVRAGDPISGRDSRHPGGPAGSRPRFPGLRVHGLSGVVGETQASGGDQSGPAHAGYTG